ncbi:MAG: two-component regulator propeller domain-containing protein [Caldilineales bacterium]
MAGTDRGVAYHDGTAWSTVSLRQQSGLPARVLALAQGSDGTLWTGGDSLHRIDGTSGKIELITGAPFQNRIQALLVTPARSKWPEALWVGTAGDGVWCYTDHWWHFGMPPPGQSAEGIASDNILALAADSSGTLWIGTNGSGISLFNPEGLSIFWGGKNWRTLTTRDGLAADAVAGIAIDSSGTAWLATIAGIHPMDVQTWQTLATPERRAFESPTAAFLDEPGRLWFATDTAGVVVVDRNEAHYITAEASGIPENMVRSVLVDHTDTVWIGTARQGIVRARVADVLNTAEGHQPSWQRVSGEALGSNVVRASLVARDGSLWFGTYNGVHRFTYTAHDRSGQWTNFTVDNGLADNIVSQNAIVEDGDGRIWVGTSTGVNRLDPGASQWTSYRFGGSAANKILSMAVPGSSSTDRAIWAGDAAGDIYALNSATDQWILVRQLDSPIFALLAPDDGFLWAGTGAGLVKLDVETMAQRIYTRDTGLSDNEVHVLTRGPSGAVWVGTKTGIVRHQPEEVPPTVRVISVNGKSPAGGTVQFLSQTPIGIAVEGSDLATPASDIDYRLRIPELSTAWQNISEEHWTLDPLPSGRYTLEVQAVDNALNTSAIERTTLEVVPSVIAPLLGRVPVSLATVIAVSTVTAVTGLAGIALLTIRQRKRRRAALRRRFNPYVSGEPIARQEMFFGRSEILARIVDTLHENSIMIHGERRIGKTSLLLHLVDYLQGAEDDEFMFVPVYIDLEGTYGDQLFSVMMEEIIDRLPGYLPEMPRLRYHDVEWSEYDHREFGRDLDIVLDALAETTRKTVRVVLVLDEMDVMNTFQPVTQQQLRRIFMRSYAHSLGAVVAGVNISKTWDRVESPWYNLFNEVELGPLTDEAARDLILEPIRGIYQIAPEAVAYIALHARGKPYLLQQHCMEAVNLMLAAGRNRITLDDARRALVELQRHRPPKARPPGRRSLKTQRSPS